MLFTSGWSQPVPEARDIQFRTLSMNGEIDGLYVRHNQDWVEIRARTHARSPFYPATIVEGSPLILYRRDTTTEPETVWTPAAYIRLPGSNQQLLLLLDSSDDKITGTAIPEDFEAHPPGTCRFINATPYRLAVMLGDQTALLTPTSSRTIRPRQKDNRVTVQMAASTPEPVVFYSNKWKIRSEDRWLVIAGSTGIPRRPVRLRYIVENAAEESAATGKDGTSEQ
jgi:hypothetical protein